MLFGARNKLKATQDMLCVAYRAIPGGVDFVVRKESYGWTLRACGYGCLDRHTDECYGNGALTIPYSWTNAKWRKKLDEASIV